MATLKLSGVQLELEGSCEEASGQKLGMDAFDFMCWS